MLTRVHAYKLGKDRIQFTFAHGNDFLLVGGHYDEEASRKIKKEMEKMTIKTISTVFIPEWTEAYCGDGGHFGELLEALKPTHIIIPAWTVGKQFVARVRSYINQYKVKNSYVDVQNVFNDFQIHDTDTPSVSNNNIVILSEIVSDKNKAIFAYRFEASGKWTTINLEDNTYDDEVLKSDVVVYPTLDSVLCKKMETAASRLKANVKIKFLKFVRPSILRNWIFKKGLVYSVYDKDVVVSKDNSDTAICYYLDSSTNFLSEQQRYLIL